MSLDEVLRDLEGLADPGSLPGMARFGIDTSDALGVRLPDLRRLARRIGKDTGLSDELWAAGGRETRILAGLVCDPAHLTEPAMEAWAAEFGDWEICDQTCMNLFARSTLAWSKAGEWAVRPEEFVKRAGLVIMARLAVGRPGPDDQRLLAFLDPIEAQAADPRPYVHKAVNWALRQIGKRSPDLWTPALSVAERLADSEARPARWVGRDAVRELRSEAVLRRLQIT